MEVVSHGSDGRGEEQCSADPTQDAEDEDEMPVFWFDRQLARKRASFGGSRKILP